MIRVTKEWRRILSFIAEGLILFDEKGRITVLNPHSTLLLDIVAGDVIGKSVDKIFDVYIDNELLSTNKRFTYSIFKLKIPFYTPQGKTVYFKSASGKKFPVFVAARELEIQGKRAGILVFRDITTEKKLENYKTDTTKRLATLTPILQKTAMGDLSSKITISRKEDEFTGLLVGLKLTIDDLRELELLREKNEEEKILNVRKAEEDKRILIEQYSKELEVKVAEQTAEVRQAYEIEKKAREDLEKLDKNKDDFILTTQHHLRTPLTIMRGYLQTLLQTPPQPFVDKTKMILQRASDSTDRLISLVNEFLDISQMEVGKSVLNKESVDTETVIKEVASELQPEADTKKISIQIDAPAGITMSLDRSRIKEAITNLVDNSIKYSHEGGEIKIKGEKTFHPIERTKEIYRLSVSDNGIGLTPEEQGKLFVRYFERGEEARKTNATGRGIGMVVTKDIVEVHGGRIYAESAGRDKGSKFVIELPFEKA